MDKSLHTASPRIPGGHTREAFERVVNARKCLAESIERLRESACDALIPPGPADATEAPGAPTPPRSPLADALDLEGYYLENLNRSLNELIDRLDV